MWYGYPIICRSNNHRVDKLVWLYRNMWVCVWRNTSEPHLFKCRSCAWIRYWWLSWCFEWEWFIILWYEMEPWFQLSFKWVNGDTQANIIWYLWGISCNAIQPNSEYLVKVWLNRCTRETGNQWFGCILLHHGRWCLYDLNILVQ